MRKVISINNGWLFCYQYVPGMEKKNDFEEFEEVNLPHTNKELPYNYFDEEDYQKISCYAYPLEVTEEYRNRKVFVHFEAVMAYAKVYVNGIYAGEHKGGYTPFDIDIADKLDFAKKRNYICVVADATERDDIPPFGGEIDYLTYGGIYREASIVLYDDVYIQNMKVETYKVLEDKKDVCVKLYVKNDCDETKKAKVAVKLIEESSESLIYEKSFECNVKPGEGMYEFNAEGISGIRLWDIDNPNLYEVEAYLSWDGSCSLCKGDGSCDCFKDRIGFRTCEFTTMGFFLNGKKLKLMGLNRHQSYPYVGYAMPKRVQEKDADILKNDLHVNIVRTSHYPQSRHFLNKCDEIGLLVLEEIPGWQYIGGAAWKEVAKQNVREMVERDWNHPGIILWGVRINESADDDEFYTETNKIAHMLDITRQTGGIRCRKRSKLLEDVYTFNDFVHEGVNGPLRDQQEVTGLDHKVPYMVTENNGHMFPTKRFDQEERQVEHSLRHLRVQDASFRDDSISGTIDWCAFDYNTHKDFGSGDRICYHGVMDMFRIHKFASYVFKSQVSPEKETVLEPVTFWTRGDRNIGDFMPLVIFTNCDYVEFKYGDNEVKKIYPRREEYKGIPNPPVVIDYSVISREEAGEWGELWENAYFAGYHNGKMVIERKMSKNPLPTELKVEVDDNMLTASEKDATRFTVKVLDQCGNIMPFIDEIIKIKIEGPLKLQGPDEVVVKGGAIGFWVETLNKVGTAKVTVDSARIGQSVHTITIQ